MAMLVKPAEHAWLESSGLADNATAVAQREGQAGKSHYITLIRASYSSPSTSGVLTLKVDGVPIAEAHVHGYAEIAWNPALGIVEGKTVSAELSASGTAGVTGSVLLSGYTI